MNSVHVLLDKIGQATDYYLLPSWRLRHWNFATHLKRLFAELSVDLVLDVGANKGQYHDFLRRHVGYRGPIVSFEPTPQNAALLNRRAAGEEGWEIHACALGPTTGPRAFNVMKRDTLSSFLQPDNRESSPRLAEHNSVAEVQEVTMKSLADVWPELVSRYGPGRSVYLKMDTQGFDLEVMRGAEPILAEIAALQTELLLRPLYEGAPSYTQALLAFEALGFDVAGFFPVSHDTRGRLRACDCTMLNRTRAR